LKACERLTRCFCTLSRDQHACSAPGCDEVFLRKGLLQEHLRTHEDFRPFACTVDGACS
jgi:uncharacterized Zn-finger protein